MEFGLRDVIYIAVYVATVAALFAGFKSRLNKLQESIESVKNILFLEKGGLNLVDNNKCKEHQDSVYQMIRRESEVTSDAIDQMQVMNQNMIKIMLHMNLEPVAAPPKKRNKGFHMEPLKPRS